MVSVLGERAYSYWRCFSVSPYNLLTKPRSSKIREASISIGVLVFLAFLYGVIHGDCYSKDEVELQYESYRDEISMLEDRIAELEGALLSSYDEGYATGLGEGYDDGHTVGYESGYDDGHSDGYNSGYDEGYDSGASKTRRNTISDTISEYPEWLLDSDVTDFWGELYNALAAFWSGDTSGLSSFEDGLYDVILDIYAEYKAGAGFPVGQ